MDSRRAFPRIQGVQFSKLGGMLVLRRPEPVRGTGSSRVRERKKEAHGKQKAVAVEAGFKQSLKADSDAKL